MPSRDGSEEISAGSAGHGSNPGQMQALSSRDAGGCVARSRHWQLPGRRSTPNLPRLQPSVGPLAATRSSAIRRTQGRGACEAALPQRPNANLYGAAAHGTYGRETFADIAARCHARATSLGVALDLRQSQDEGELIGQAGGWAQGTIINAAGLSYTSIALMDALQGFEGPVIEVHMSNIHRRELFRHPSFTAPAAMGSICGFGPLGYGLAILAMARP